MGPICTVTGTSGKRVSENTLSHLLREEAFPLTEKGEWYFCGDPDCEIVYFTADGETRSKDALRVRVGLKESTPPRPLCYCFGYSFEDVERDAAAADVSSIAAEITEKCRQGLDRCEETNPQGSCCLGNVRRAFKEAQARSRRSPRSVEEKDGSHDCCNAKARKEIP
jgi:hypothetical protein